MFLAIVLYGYLQRLPCFLLLTDTLVALAISQRFLCPNRHVRQEVMLQGCRTSLGYQGSMFPLFQCSLGLIYSLVDAVGS